MKSRFLGVVVLGVLMVLVSCKPNANNELNKFNNNMRIANKYVGLYAGLGKQLAVVSQKAYAILQQGEKIQDIDKKAEKYAEANKVFDDSSLFGQAMSYDSRLGNIEKLRNKVENKMHSVKFRKYKYSAQNVLAHSANLVSSASEIMRNAKPTNVDEAYEKVKEANGKLIDAENDLNRINDKMKTKKRYRKKK